MNKNIKRTESQMDLVYKTIDLYEPRYCSKDNEYCSLKSSHIIKMVHMKKPFEFVHGFKSHCTSINEHLSKLEGYPQSRLKNKINKFTPFGNEFFPPSKNISLTSCPIMYPLKKKDIFDYDPRFIISSGLMFDDIIINIIRSKKLAHPIKENDYLFIHIEKISFLCTGVTSSLLLENRNL